MPTRRINAPWRLAPAPWKSRRSCRTVTVARWWRTSGGTPGRSRHIRVVAASAGDRTAAGRWTTMRLPVIEGTLGRRLRVNFRVEPAVLRAPLPPRFSPKLHDGHAIAGICLIRLEAIRPRHFPALVGVSSENAAHRVAVVWTDENGEQKEGVFIPRRDTSSLVNHLGGGRIFPGEHHRAAFEVREDPRTIDLEMRSRDGEVTV